MAPVALAFAVLDSTDRTGDLGVILAAHVIPLLGFLLVGGAVADRFPRRAVLVAANLGSALTQGAVAVVLLTGHYNLALIATLEFGNGALNAFTTPALRGIVPDLVPKPQLQHANSILGATRSATTILGPIAAGLLVTGFGGGWAIAVDAISFLVAAGFLSRLEIGGAGRSVPADSFSVRQEIRQGWAEFRRLRWVRTVSGAFCLMNLAQVGSWQVLGPTVIASPAAWGAVLSARGLGMLAGGLAMYRLTFGHLLRAGQLACTLAALPLITLGLRYSTGWLLVAALVGGVGTAISSISWDTTLQDHVDPTLLARVSSYDDLLSYAAIPVGQLAVVPLAAAFGPAAVCLGAGVVVAVSAALPLLSPQVRHLR